MALTIPNRLTLAVIAAWTLPACASMEGVARDRFAAEHEGCRKVTVTERTDLHSQAPGEQPASLTHQGYVVYEVAGCNAHDLESCESAWDNGGGNVSPGGCGSLKVCDTPGCTGDYAGVVRAQFSKDSACPAERIATEPIPPAPDAPADIATDPARLSLWTQAHQDQIKAAQSQTWLKAKGCDSEGRYSCHTIGWPVLPICKKAAAP
jgi:hypothetical protein